MLSFFIRSRGGQDGNAPYSTPVYEDQAFLSSQSGTAYLDKFTHCLFVKCGSEMLDTLLNTLIKQIQMAQASGNKEVKAEARAVAKR